MSQFGGALDAIRWPEDGLIPAVAQDEQTGVVLMTAFMDREALATTLETGLVHYRSRSRNARWLKGESSGNVQRLSEIRVNCDRNSLLLLVRQHGAVCHDGFPSCYYRRLERDGSLAVLHAREFDPRTVYGGGADADAVGGSGLAASARLLFGAYAWLRDHDLETESGTSRRLRAAEDTVSARLADELEELAGAVLGEHLHGSARETALIEATQCLYWTTLAALRAGEPWAAYRPDLALAGRDGGPEADPSPEAAALALRETAAAWRSGSAASDPWRFRTAARVVGAAARAAGVSPAEIVEADLAELRTRPYLRPWFSGAGE
ncbi:MAG: phosphoribosyl-AMP cyclohydrolase [Chloroflexota bacterium]